MRTLFVLAVWTVYALCHLNGFHTYPCVDWKMRTAWPRYVASHPLVDAKEAPAPTAGNHTARHHGCGISTNGCKKRHVRYATYDVL